MFTGNINIQEKRKYVQNMTNYCKEMCSESYVSTFILNAYIAQAFGKVIHSFSHSFISSFHFLPFIKSGHSFIQSTGAFRNTLQAFSVSKWADDTPLCVSIKSHWIDTQSHSDQRRSFSVLSVALYVRKLFSNLIICSAITFHLQPLLNAPLICFLSGQPMSG